ncbi:MAG: hypothetical protein ACXW15_07950 [Acidimicrobiia bacterium]
MTDHERTHEVSQRRRTVGRRVVSPAQIVAGIIGLILVVIGGVVLARVGLSSLTGDTTTVLGIGHTALMGLIDVVAGLFFLGAAASSGVRGALIGLSLVAIAFGAIVAIEPTAFDSALGGGRELGFLYLIVGVMGLLAALAFRTTVVDRVATEETEATTTE